MIVVDSSVWIANLRDLNRFGSPIARTRSRDGTRVGRRLDPARGAAGRPRRQHAGRIERALRQFPVEPMLDPDLAVRAARNVRASPGRGTTARNTKDIIIGKFCVERGHQLLHEDRDFLPMARHLGLRVL